MNQPHRLAHPGDNQYSIFRLPEALTCWPAVAVMGATYFGAALLFALGAMLARVSMLFPILLGVVAFVLALAGTSGAGVCLTDLARKRPYRSVVSYCVAGLLSLPKLLGAGLLMLLAVQAQGYAPKPLALPKALRWGVWLLLVLSLLQVSLGGWVSTNYAVLACTDFPACQGSFWPAMDFQQGFTLWRELGAGHDGANISFQALTAIHYVHRLGAYAVFAVLMTLAYALNRLPGLRTQARWLAGLTLLQVVTGVSNVVLGWPLLAAVAHTGGAAALVVVLTGIVCSRRSVAERLPNSPLNASRLTA